MKNKHKQQTTFSHIKLTTAPIFSLLILAITTFIIVSVININNNYVFVLDITILIFTGIFVLIKQNNIAFMLLGICLGLTLFANANNNTIHFKDKSYPKQPAIIHGKVIEIISKKEDRTRLILNGEITSKELPKLNNYKVLLTIYGKNRIEYGSTITAYCNIQPPRIADTNSDFSERSYAKNIGVSWVATTNSNAIKIVNLPDFIDKTKNNVYTSISSHINKLFTSNAAGFVQALILGNKLYISNDIKQHFRISGVSHILSLSGLHIGIIVAMLFIILSLFPVNKWVSLILMTIFITAFIFLTGMLPSAIRAGGMAILFMLGKTIQRPTNTLNIISAVILISIIISPDMLYSISFQLSVTAVLGIYIFYKVFTNSFYYFIKTEKTIIKYLLNSLALTLSASIIINPLVAYYFNMLSIISPLTNLFIVPVFTLILVFAIIAVILSYIYIPIALLYAGSVELLINIVTKITQLAATLNFAAITKHDHIIIISITISLVIAYIFSSRKKKQLLFRTGVSTICCVMLYWFIL